MEQIKEILKDFGWQITEESETEWQLENFSELGEDLLEFIEFDGTIKNFVEKFEEIANSFDVDEHAEVYINMRGENGVPDCSIRDLVEDAEWIEGMYQETLIKLKEKLKESEEN